MSVSGGHDIGARGVDLRVNREGCPVDRVLPFHDLALVIHQNEVGDANLTEVHAEGIDPEMIEAFGVASGDVASDAFIESESREQAEGTGQALLAMPAFLFQRGEPGGSGKVERVLGGNSHGRLHAISGQL
jgi:hypothetical protein